ncbi:hypothetical protein AV530_003236 [Patagioenas fasciata monilis]|uniref:Uncharacterized protein n=1 Tax=Patagioenas fasciata monilis TaxID=372326 RepID=A0A1V4KWE7_PATFA|nr:hypothetical protein AV530_003236 [Patagioenas fasciata monilis]
MDFLPSASFFSCPVGLSSRQRRGVPSVFCLQKEVNTHVLALPSTRATGSVAAPLSGGDRGRRPKGHHTEDALVGQNLGNWHLCGGG